MKATYDETILMDGLVLVAREQLVEAEEVQAGRKARLTLYNEDGTMRSYSVPFRVAAYARKAMGVPAVVREGVRVLFTSRGITVAYYPTEFGYEGIRATILAYLYAQTRHVKRERRVLKALIRQCEARRAQEAKQQKGGAAA